MIIEIKGAHLFDPFNKIDEKGNLYIINGKVKGKSLSPPEFTIDATHLYLMPAFVDLHTHLREPGNEDAETIETGSKAAVKGGYATICAMPNTNPPVDNEGVARYIIDRAKQAGFAKVYPIGTITKARQGKEISEIGHLVKAGCVGVSDDGSPVMDGNVMRRALEYTKIFDIPVIEHPEDLNLSGNGQINEGVVSADLGFDGLPSVSETVIVARDILLAKFTGGRLHLAHISTKESLLRIERMKREVPNITCEVTPHHLTLTEEQVRTFDTNTKMKPPLRTREDVNALIKGLDKGIIDAIATDHAPHPRYKKELEYSLAAFGVIGLETSFSVLYTKLVKTGKITLNTLVSKMTSSPANAFNLNFGEIKEDGMPDFVLVDLNKQWKVEEDSFVSKSSNSPFIGWNLDGKVIYTIVNGNLVFNNGEFIPSTFRQ